MGRLGWALLQALALHFLLLLAVVPDHGRLLPEVQGSGRITVSIDRLGPQPRTAADGAPEEEVDSGGAADRQKKVSSVAGHPTEKGPAPLIGPQRTKKEIRAEPADDHGAAPQTDGKTLDAAARPGSPPTGGTQTDASGSAGHEAVRPAAPVAVENQPPDYPELARRRGWEGTVLLAVRVGMDGRVDQAGVRTGSSYRLLDEAALEAVRRWRFQPGTRNGRPEVMEVLVPVHFVLREAERQ